MPLKFQYTQYLFILLALPLMIALYFFVLHWKKKTIKKMGDERLIKMMTQNYSPQRFALKFILLISTFTFIVFALANLRKPQGAQKINRNGIDVMFALDVSKSMLAQDIKPSRLDRAKQILAKLIDKLSEDRIGLIVFAGKAYMQMPLTGDYAAAKMYLSSATPDMVPTQGTVIGDALKMCYQSFNKQEKKYKSVVLISDGEDHDEEAASIASQMAGEGIIINTIGIGSPEGSPIVDATTNEIKKDKEGNTVITKLNEAELKNIAQKGNGIYQLYTTSNNVVDNLYAQLSSMDGRKIIDDSMVNYQSFFQYFLAIAFLLLIIEIFITEKIASKNNALKLGKTAAGLPIIFCLLPLFSVAQNKIIKDGNEAYKKNQFENAAQYYKKVIDAQPANATAQFNWGNALYKNKKNEEAIAAYDNAFNHFNSKEEKAKALYNKGVVLQNNNKLAECITAYKNALKLNAQDDDARQNLQKALQQQKQQQNKNMPKPKPKENQQKKDNENKKNEEKKQSPPPSKISQQDAEEKLKALLQQEKNLQDKLQKINNASANKPEKDW